MEVLFVDEAVLVVNKPAGLLTIADGYQAQLPHLSGQLRQEFGLVWVVHRLDKETSGVIVFARSEAAHRELNQQFRERLIVKEYHAIVQGHPEWERMTADLPLRTNGDRRHRTVIDHQAGKPAQTGLRVLSLLESFALVEAQPKTGYTHQIRAHLAFLGFPLLHDPLYRSLRPATAMSEAAGARTASLPIQRTALHAYRITFQHPLDHVSVSVSAPYPVDFAETLAVLSKS